MIDSEKMEIRMNCLIEASKLKQSPIMTQELQGKSVVDIAKDLEVFVLGV